MSTTELGQTIALTSYVFRLFKAYWAALQERRKRARVRTVLYDLSDGELRDIGIARGEIDDTAVRCWSADEIAGQMALIPAERAHPWNGRLEVLLDTLTAATKYGS